MQGPPDTHSMPRTVNYAAAMLGYVFTQVGHGVHSTFCLNGKTVESKHEKIRHSSSLGVNLILCLCTWTVMAEDQHGRGSNPTFAPVLLCEPLTCVTVPPQHECQELSSNEFLKHTGLSGWWKLNNQWRFRYKLTNVHATQCFNYSFYYVLFNVITNIFNSESTFAKSISVLLVLSKSFLHLRTWNFFPILNF